MQEGDYSTSKIVRLCGVIKNRREQFRHEKIAQAHRKEPRQSCEGKRFAQGKRKVGVTFSIDLIQKGDRKRGHGGRKSALSPHNKRKREIGEKTPFPCQEKREKGGARSLQMRKVEQRDGGKPIRK